MSSRERERKSFCQKEICQWHFIGAYGISLPRFKYSWKRDLLQIVSSLGKSSFEVGERDAQSNIQILSSLPLSLSFRFLFDIMARFVCRKFAVVTALMVISKSTNFHSYLNSLLSFFSILVRGSSLPPSLSCCLISLLSLSSLPLSLFCIN